MSKVKNNVYVVIQGWYINELKLKGNELMVYSIIYGFCQDGESRFTGSLQYLADWTNSTKQGVMKVLKSLVEKKLIIKSEKFINNVKFCEYKINDDVLTDAHKIKKDEKPSPSLNARCATEFNEGMQLSLPRCATEFNEGMQLSCNNNLLDKDKNNLDNTIVASSVSDGHDREEQNLKTEKRNVKERKIVDEEAKSLAQLLLDLHREIDPKFTTRTLDKWAEDIEKIHRLDNRTYNEIRTVIYWAKRDDFWKTNIMSGKKLREKFPMLYAKMTAVPSGYQKKPLTNEIDQSKQKYYANEDGSIPW